MRRCPNCDRETARTEDWACPWCGYPLLSKRYQTLGQTYAQMKEREQGEEQPQEEEPDVTITDIPEPEPAPEPIIEAKPEPEPTPEPTVEAEPAVESEPMPEPEPAPMLEPEPAPIVEPEPEPESSPTPDAEPAAIEITIDELNSVYTTNFISADIQFSGKILRVTGVTDRVSAEGNPDKPNIILTSTKEEQAWNVRCLFGEEHRGKLNSLAAGQKLSVQGEYDGYEPDTDSETYKIDIIMKNCALAD